MDITQPTIKAGLTRRAFTTGLSTLGVALLARRARAAGPMLAEVKAATGPFNILGAHNYETPDSWPKNLQVTWAYNTTNEEILTKTTQPGTFDAVIIYQGEIDQLRKLDRLVPIDTSLLENWHLVAPLFRDASVIRRDGQVFAVPFHWGYGYLEYNADKTDAPTSLQDLMSPKLTKKIGLPDDPYAVITTFALFAGYSNANNLSREQFDKTIKLLKSFRPQVLTIHNYGDEPALFGRGDIWVGLPEYSESIVLCHKAGATAVRSTLLAAWSYVDCLMVLKAAEHPAAAYNFINSCLSAESQKLTTARSLAFPVDDAAISALPKELQYTSSEEVLKKAPLMPGVTVETGGPDVPFQDWVKAWEEFKAA
jgi:putative spermidine/putrescine transport system substrate-binding protein/spermidine/putrescine transport system substrate-binding protein